jgi:hypothetical protein
MPVERTTIANDNSSGGMGVAVAVIAAIVLVAVLVWAFNGGLNFGPSSGGTVDVDVPAVTVTPDGQ